MLRDFGSSLKVWLLLLIGGALPTPSWCHDAMCPNESASKSSPTEVQAVNFAKPLRDYTCRRVAGWSVLIEEEMVTKDSVLADRIQRRVATKLKEVRSLLPVHTLSVLQRVPIFFMYGDKSSRGGRARGAQYFAESAPDFNKRLDPRMAGAIVIYSAEHFCSLSEFGATKMLLHELSHAWHLEQWSENKPDIMLTFKGAVEKHLYEKVRKSDGSTLQKAYALENQLEYFAELSCVWFCGNDHFPFDRGDLALYDPSGYQLMQQLWSGSGKKAW